jgi:protein Tex
LDMITAQIAQELKVRPAQVNAAVALLDGGATVPFIARYRKEATEGLDDIQLRELESRLTYLRELQERRTAILKSIEEQGKLTPELSAAIAAAPHQSHGCARSGFGAFGRQALGRPEFGA